MSTSLKGGSAMWGTVIYWNEKKGFGFVKAENDVEYFLHISNLYLQPGKFEGLKAGLRMEIRETTKGRGGKPAITDALSEKASEAIQARVRERARAEEMQKLKTELQPALPPRTKLVGMHLEHEVTGNHLVELVKQNEDLDLDVARARLESVREDLPILEKLWGRVRHSEYAAKIRLSYFEQSFSLQVKDEVAGAVSLPIDRAEPERSLQKLLEVELPERERRFAAAIAALEQCPQLLVKTPGRRLGWIVVKDLETGSVHELRLEDLDSFVEANSKNQK